MRKHHITALVALLLVPAIALAGCDDNADADIERSMSIVLYDSSILKEERANGAVFSFYRADWDIDTGELYCDNTSMMTLEGDYDNYLYWDGHNQFMLNENALSPLESDSDIEFEADERDPTVFYGEGITMYLEDDIAELAFDDGEELSFSIQPEEAPEAFDGTYLSNSIIGLGVTDTIVTIVYKMLKVDDSASLFCVQYDRGDGSVTWSEAIELTGHDTSDLTVQAWFNNCYFDGVRLYYSGFNIWCYNTSTNEVYELEDITQSVENMAAAYTRETLFGTPLVSNVLGGMQGTVICYMTLVNTDTGEFIGVSYAIAEASLIGALTYNGETITSYDANLDALAVTVIDLPLGSVGMKYPNPYYHSEG